MKKLRVGFLVDDLSVDYYVADLIEFVAAEENFDSPIIISGYFRKEIKPSLFSRISYFIDYNLLRSADRIFRAVLSKLIKNIERRIVQKRFPHHYDNICFSNREFQQINIEGSWSRSGLILRFDSAELAKLETLNLDCLIRCGSGILKGDILNVARFGVLSFHHGDNRVNRGGPSGFWEVLNDVPSSGFVIQKLTEELDGGEILLRGNLMTSDFWHLNRAQLLEKSNFFFKSLLVDVSLEGRLPHAEGISLHGNRLLKIDSASVLAKYVAKVLAPKLFEIAKNKVFSPVIERWSVAYAKHNNFSKSLWRYKEVTNPKGRFLADPFVFSKNGLDYIFVEDLFFSDNKGRISVIEILDGGHQFLGVALEESFHLSFPFVFEDEGEIYMVPEAHQSNQIRLYKCDDFPMKWSLDTVLMEDISAADTMVFKIDRKWFLLTNISSQSASDHNSELHIFYSEELRSSKWHSIGSGNPVIFDSGRARNAGFFWHDGHMHRVNQVHGKAHYGKSFAVNKVKQISEIEYAEERAFEIAPNFKDDILSTHHFSANDRIAVVDYCRKERFRSAIRT